MRVCHERGLFRLHVTRERRCELRLIKEEITVLWWQDRRHRCVWRRILNETVHRLTFVRRKRGDIDEPRDFRIVARLGDNRPAVGMPDENYRAGLSVNNAFGYGDIIGERYRRILNDRNCVAVLPQNVIDALPTRAVHKTTVHQNHCLCYYIFSHDHLPSS